MSKVNRRKSKQEKAIDVTKRISYIKLKYNLDKVLQNIHNKSSQKKS